MSDKRPTLQALLLDDALDDLPRYYAVVDQPKDGVLHFGEHEPRMVCCVTVDDVREMLRRKLLRETA